MGRQRQALILAWAALPMASMASGEPSVSVAADRASYAAADAIRVTVGNATARSIFLPGCNAFLLERREGDAWKVTREKRCFWEGVAFEVAARGSRTFEEPAEGLPAGTYRIRLDYHEGCKAGVPISEAHCTGQGRTDSPEFRIE